MEAPVGRHAASACCDFEHDFQNNGGMLQHVVWWAPENPAPGEISPRVPDGPASTGCPSPAASGGHVVPAMHCVLPLDPEN